MAIPIIGFKHTAQFQQVDQPVSAGLALNHAQVGHGVTLRNKAG